MHIDTYSHIYIYTKIYIYTYAVKLLSGPSLAKLFLANKNSGLKRFLHTQLSFSVLFCAQLSGSYLKIAFFSKNGCKNWVFQMSVFFKLIFGKFSFLGLLKHYTNRGFSRFLCFLFLNEKKGKKNDNWNF